MDRRLLKMVVLVLGFLMAFLVQQSAAQTTHVVGDSIGWTIPSGGGDQVYRVWADDRNFTVGDSLVFNFESGHHDVVQLKKKDYEDCTTFIPISVDNSGPATIKLNYSGPYYFICSYGHHCIAGQKLAINVRDATTSTPPPQPSATAPLLSPPNAPSPSPISLPTHSPSSSTPVTYVIGVSAAFASIFAAFCLVVKGSV